MKYVAFDLGNVLVEVYLDQFISELNIELGEVSSDKANRFLENIQGFQDIGVTTVKKELSKLTGLFYPHAEEHLVSVWESILKPNEEMLNFVNELKRCGCEVAILSNIGQEHRKVIWDKWPELFEDNVLHLSCEVGARKPSKLYFQSFLMEHPEFRGCCYFDDLDDNLASGQKFGFEACKFELDKFMKYSEIERGYLLSDKKKLILEK